MTITPTITPVRHQVSVPLDPGRAFALYVDEFDTWWPREHHIGEADVKRVVIEPAIGGRVYEIGIDGSECDWGAVTTYEAPHRLVVSWHLNGQWEYDPDPDHASEYEVTFVENADGGTDVALEHRNFDRHGEAGAGIAAAVAGPTGWPGLLTMYAEKA